MEILIALLLALNIGAIIYALIDIVKSNFQKPRQVKTGWIWVVILFQGPGSLIYFLTKERMGWSIEVEAVLMTFFYFSDSVNVWKDNWLWFSDSFLGLLLLLTYPSSSPYNLCSNWVIGRVAPLLGYNFLQVLLLSVLWYCENLLIFPLVSTKLYEKTPTPLFGIGLRHT